MPAYVVAILKETDVNDDIRSYLERIDPTLKPYEGRYIVHGGPYQYVEGEPDGDLVMLEFPTLELASQWYESAAYREIKPLRTNNSSGTVFLVQGVPPSHRATDILGG
ncbi:DUF1330 domain-containing protein [Pusillimonas sp. MFBS29]|uniref:DUF1330 domain-containing protein n=1 Tax=Pusillimonas sp. MFBS29 TaxID=2886690 RepID=UPI001D12DD6B|nr:DUF1330 domain-containing protein [Pusillimonas sp. MFBS29]MCC2594852.1 DUF1330 domain-containing protein [Pusillimonas sp. MFBS29]